MPSSKRPRAGDDPFQDFDRSRRAFLKRLITAGAYVAPVITTYALAGSSQPVKETNANFPFRHTPTPTPTKRHHS